MRLALLAIAVGLSGCALLSDTVTDESRGPDPDLARQAAAWVPPGTPLEEAECIMTGEGFDCAVQRAEAGGPKGKSHGDRLVCQKGHSGRGGPRWWYGGSEVTFAVKGGTVGQCEASSFRVDIGPRRPWFTSNVY